jgi:hypothetical protein
VAAPAGIAYASRSVPGGGGAADAEDCCPVPGELVSGAQVALSVSRVARGARRARATRSR